ncbi:11299_t:CDS:2, partial [Gigaspora margarita]
TTDEKYENEEISLIWRSLAVPVTISTTKKVYKKEIYIVKYGGKKNAHSNNIQAKNKAKRPLQLTKVNINAVNKNQKILEEMTTNSSDKD